MAFLKTIDQRSLQMNLIASRDVMGRGLLIVNLPPRTKRVS
jgi:hypothetical protein